MIWIYESIDKNTAKNMVHTRMSQLPKKAGLWAKNESYKNYKKNQNFKIEYIDARSAQKHDLHLKNRKNGKIKKSDFSVAPGPHGEDNLWLFFRGEDSGNKTK